MRVDFFLPTAYNRAQLDRFDSSVNSDGFTVADPDLANRGRSMVSSPFPGMDPFLEINPRWEVFHGWFIRE
ncbi:MAG: hypothetical protein EA424_05340 [Planctomycetaceae bacterium]|nr:MAG: hypothetical protein EA424_05340 [Planctomycetaceae bacterium]